MRTSKTTYTLTCDRCGHQETVHDDNKEEMEAASKWKNLNTGAIFFFSSSFDLCPDCYEVFKEEFMSFLPPAFKNAFDDKK